MATNYRRYKQHRVGRVAKNWGSMEYVAVLVGAAPSVESLTQASRMAEGECEAAAVAQCYAAIVYHRLQTLPGDYRLALREELGATQYGALLDGRRLSSFITALPVFLRVFTVSPHENKKRARLNAFLACRMRAVRVRHVAEVGVLGGAVGAQGVLTGPFLLFAAVRAVGGRLHRGGNCKKCIAKCVWLRNVCVKISKMLKKNSKIGVGYF